jgi:tRNA(Arg) A34 adenosine deaminase TadA
MSMLNEIDLGHLRAAIALAGSARSHGNHPFGALLVGADGRVLAEAENSVVTTRDCTGHAELNLVRLATTLHDEHGLSGSTLYTSTEPCAMCAGAIYWSGIGRVVYALAEERLYALAGSERARDAMRLPCREVFARCGRGVAVDGPAQAAESEEVHIGFWEQGF